MGRLEVLNKRQEVQIQGQAPIVDESDKEQTNEDKVVNIVSSSWRNIIQDRKQGAAKSLGKEPEPEPTGFFLDFGDAPVTNEISREQIAKEQKPKTVLVNQKFDPASNEVPDKQEDKPVKPKKEKKKKS